MRNHTMLFYRYRRVKGNIIQLDSMHVPKEMKGRGVSSALAREVLNYMTDQHMWIDVRCPITKSYIKNNQYAQYVRQMVQPLSLRQAPPSTF